MWWHQVVPRYQREKGAGKDKRVADQTEANRRLGLNDAPPLRTSQINRRGGLDEKAANLPRGPPMNKNKGIADMGGQELWN